MWTLTAWLYQKLRKRFLFKIILNRECATLRSLLKIIPNPPEVVIDLGTGEGTALEMLPFSCRQFGVDSCLLMLSYARHRVQASFINGDVQTLPIKNNIADLILSIGVLEYVPDVRRVLYEIYRISKPHAYALISFSPNNSWTLLRQFLGHRIYPLTASEVCESLHHTGFHCIEYRQLTMQHQMLIQKNENMNQ